ncbi:MAG: RnfABCDGE type electron transport complex subunit G [Gammaproteobacteria bacterium]|nr:RnfABCDGE type electron transport complex subunit G [Gammaproteobacteria bacterium]
MSSAQQSMQQPDSPTTRMILVLTGIAMLSGFLVVLVAQLTAPVIAENQRIAIEKAVVKVIPGATTHKEFYLEDGKLVTEKQNQDSDSIYAGYNAEGKLLGVAAKAAAQGYAGMIYLLYGYEPSCECIRGIKVLKMAETPGLGDKIITDNNFQANFDALDAKVDIANRSLANEIVTVKAGTRQHDWEIDAISGATISSVAVGKALNESAQRLMPQVLTQLHVLEQSEVIHDAN